MSKTTSATRGDRQFISTGNRWERRYGYSRAVRVGQQIWITGTLGINAEGRPVGDVGQQATRAFAIIADALEAADSSLADVVRVRGYLTDTADIDTVGDVFARIFKPHDVQPCLIQVAVAALTHPEATVELEAEAVVTHASSTTHQS